MPALTINGYTVGIAADAGAGRGISRVGPRDAIASDGSILRSSRAQKLSLGSLRTTLLDATVADSLIRILHGFGEVWNFNAASDADYGSKGTTPEAGSVGIRRTSIPSPKYGDAYWRVASGNHLEVDMASTAYTVMFWRHLVSGQWDHYALTSDGDYWDNGTKNSGTDPANFTDVTGTLLKLEAKDDAGSGATAYYDDLVVLPFVCADAIIEAVAADSEPFGVLPKVSAGGDLVPGSSRLDCFAMDPKGKTVAISNGFKVSVGFSLREA